MATRRTAAGMLAVEVVRSTAVAVEAAAIVTDVMVMIAEDVINETTVGSAGLVRGPVSFESPRQFGDKLWSL